VHAESGHKDGLNWADNWRYPAHSLVATEEAQKDQYGSWLGLVLFKLVVPHLIRSGWTISLYEVPGSPSVCWWRELADI
jgi:hypothetical protein